MNTNTAVFLKYFQPLAMAVFFGSLLLLSACADSDDPAAQVTQDNNATNAPENISTSASSRLDELIQQYADRQSGEENSPGLTEYSEQTHAKESETNRHLLAQISDVDSTQLDLEERIDRRLLIGLLESDIYSAEQKRNWENVASLYIPAAQIGRLLEPLSEQPASKRAASLQTLLEELPQHLSKAKANLRTPPRRYTESAIFKTQGTIKSLETQVDLLLGHGATTPDEFSQTTAKAITALQDFEQFLQEDLLARSTGSWAIGKQHYDYILKHRWHLDADAKSILARGLKAFEDTQKLAQQVSERIEPGKHWSEVYEGLKDHHPSADGIKQAYQASIDDAKAFVIERQIVSLPEGERVITIDTPPAMRRSSPFGTFRSVDPFGTGLEGQLILTPIEEWMTAEQSAQRLRSHHNSWIPIIAVHEAYPGHHVHGLKTRNNPRLLRKIVREPIFSEGWGLFTEEMMFEQGFLIGDDIRLTQLRNRLWRAARVILDVNLHTGDMSFDDAVDFLIEKVRFERYAAELEVGMYTVYPTYVLGYLIGMQEIIAIREDWIETFGKPSPPREFYDRLLMVGALPPLLVRQSLFGDAESSLGVAN